MKEKITPAYQSGELKFSDLSPYEKGIVEKAIKGGFTRRDVLKLMAITGVSLATAKNLLFTGEMAMASTPKKGGSVRLGSNLHGPDDQLDPPLFTSAIDYSRGRATYNGLVQFNEDLTTRPELAESVEPNSDASEWTFKLRQGVVFHDGSPFSADDVIYSMNRHMGDDSTSVIKSLLTSIQEWKKVNSHEVKAVLNTPNADLPKVLALYQAKVVKNGTTGDGIGTGPYTLDSFEPGVKSVHSRNENYWREGALLDGVEMTGITDPVARVNALIAGDVQLINQIDPKAFRQIEDADGVTLLSIPSAQQLGICILKNSEPGSNDDFVKGMQYIQDRKKIVKRVLKGKGNVANDTPIGAAHGPDFCNELPQREFDPDKAKFHFEKSGYTTAELYVAPVAAGIEEICLMAQANCAKIGFDLKINRVPTDGYWGAVWMREPLNVVTWQMRPTAQTQMGIQFAPGAAWNDTYWNNDRMGELLNSVLAVTDPTVRHEMMCEMQTLIHNGSGMVIPAFSNVNDGIANNLMGMPKVPLGPFGYAEWPEYVWLA